MTWYYDPIKGVYILTNSDMDWALLPSTRLLAVRVIYDETYGDGSHHYSCCYSSNDYTWRKRVDGIWVWDQGSEIPSQISKTQLKEGYLLPDEEWEALYIEVFNHDLTKVELW